MTDILVGCFLNKNCHSVPDKQGRDTKLGVSLGRTRTFKEERPGQENEAWDSLWVCVGRNEFLARD